MENCWAHINLKTDNRTMEHIHIFYYIIFLSVLLAACSSENSLEDKKKALEGLKAEAEEINNKISTLEQEIEASDPTFTTEAEENAVLVAVEEVVPVTFSHKIEVRGSVASRRNVMISSQINGKIESVRVREGQKVSKGRVLLTLDADIIRNNIAELKTSLELAEAVYERQANLWKKKIGTEIQYLEAKNNKESLERRLATAQSQLDQAIIKAPFSGTVDAVPAREGEMALPGNPLVRMVSRENMYIEAEVSERYIGNFNAGDSVELYFPVHNKRISSTITSSSEVINAENRTFTIEVALPELGFQASPNQVVVLKLTDYSAEDALVVPTEIILSDQSGKFIYTTQNKEGHTEAVKTRVEVGKSYDGNTEILEGLSANEEVILEGYRDVADGVAIKKSENSTKTATL